MRMIRTLALGASMLTLTFVGTAGVGAQSPAAPPVKIGSDNFYESKLVAEIYAQALETAGYSVERNLGLGSRQDRAPAFEAGQVAEHEAKRKGTTQAPTAKPTERPSRASSTA